MGLKHETIIRQMTKRAKPVTDERSASVCVSTPISRVLDERFEQLARSLGLTKAGLLRALIIERLERKT